MLNIKFQIVKNCRRRVTKVKGTTKRYMVERARRFRQAAREEVSAYIL